MKIDFHAKGFFYGDVAQDYARHRLGFALGRFQDSIRRIEVTAEEFRSGQSFVHKECLLKVYLNRIPEPVMVTVQDASLKTAIDMAADTLRRAVVKKIERRRDAKRKKRRRPAMELELQLQ